MFILPLVVLACLLDFIVSSGLRRTRHDTYRVWNDIFDGNVNADIIINGSSRAVVQLSPAILDSALGVQSYNLGVNGYGFRMQLCRFQVFLEHNRKPNVVLHEIDYGTFAVRDDLFESEQFLPYLRDSTINTNTKKYKGFGFLDYHIPLLRYYSNYTIIRVGFIEYFTMKHFIGSKYKGYSGNSSSWDGALEIAKEKFPNGISVTPRNDMVESFKSYLNQCKKEGIQVVLVWMPEYIEGQKFVVNRDSVLTMVQGIAHDHGLPFLNYANDTLCFDRSLFYNARHLNKTGSEIFTKKLATDLTIKGIVN